MYSLHILVEWGVLQAIVKLKRRVGQRSARECVSISNPLYVVYTIYGLSHSKTTPILMYMWILILYMKPTNCLD